jgi:hypothetical protein
MAQDASEDGLGLTRRAFFAAAACAAIPATVVVEAIAAEKMPHRRAIRYSGAARFFEWREADGVETMFAFGSLEEREKFWRLAAPGGSFHKISIYRKL